MNVITPRSVSMPVLTKIAGGSLTLSRAAWMSRGTWRSFDSTRRARSVSEREVENRLRGEARRQNLGVGVGIALPRPHLLDLELARLDVRRDDGVLDLFGVGQIVDRDRLQPPREAGQRARVRVDRRFAEVFEEVVVQMDAIHRRARRMRLVEIGQIIVDEVRERLGRVHQFRPQGHYSPYAMGGVMRLGSRP